jgi:hypothetical protein
MRKSILGLLVAICFLTAGCAAFVAGAAVGGAGVVWHKGRLQDTLSASVPRVHSAVKASLRSLGIKIEEDKGDSLTAHVKAKLADGKPVWIDLRSEAPATTRLTIRVGTFGDKDFSQRILDSIKRHL